MKQAAMPGEAHMKENKRWLFTRTLLQNLAILLLVVAGVANFALALPHSPRLLEAVGIYYSRLSHHAVVAHRSLSAIVAIILLLLSLRLYKRLRIAWLITIITLCVSMALEVFRFQTFLNPMSALDLAILLVLCLSWRDFSRRSNRISIRQALTVSAVSIGLVVLYTSVGLFMNRQQYHGIANFSDSLME